MPLTSRLIHHIPLIQMHLQLIPRRNLIHQPPARLQRHQIPPIHRIAKKNPRIKLRNHTLNPRLRQRQRRMLPRRPAPKILPPHDDPIVTLKLILPHKLHIPLRQPGLRIRHPRIRIHPKKLPLIRQRRIQRQILRRNDLIRINIVPQHINLAADDRLHSTQ